MGRVKTEAGLAAITANLTNRDGWTRNPEAAQAIEVARRLRKTKHGMYASVPIICKADGCPYKNSCSLHEMGIAPYGEKCPVEIAAVEDLYYRYCEQLKIDPEDRNNTVDLMMVKEIVDIDIAILRCDNKMAIDADFIIENVVGMTEDNDPITKSEVHPAVELKMKLINQKNKTLQLLNTTRRDKEGIKVRVEADPSEKAAEMLRIQKEMQELEKKEQEQEMAYYRRMGGATIVEGEIVEVEPIGMDDEDE